MVLVVGVWCGVGGLVVGRIVDAGVCCCGWLAGCVLCRPVSTSQLSPLPGVHVWPIYPVVCWGPSNTRGCCGDLVLKVVSRLDAFSGYPCPNVANQWCPWRDSWRTRGSSVPVLSYWGQVFSSLLRAQRIGTELSHDVLNPARVPL